MIFQVRQGVFETNSSSTHTLTICSKDDYDKWKRGEVFWLDNDLYKLNTDKNFVTPEELEELAEKYNEKQQKRIDEGDRFAKVLDIDKVLNERSEYNNSYYDTERSALKAYTTDDFYVGNDNLETYSKTFTSPSGDEMVAFGAFGYDC
jgi:hypothetical protein